MLKRKSNIYTDGSCKSFHGFLPRVLSKIPYFWVLIKECQTNFYAL